MKTLDLTHEYKEGMRGGRPQFHPAITIERMGKIEENGFNTSSILIGTHTGTHIDGNRHLVAKGTTVDAIPFDYLVGPVNCVDMTWCGKNYEVTLDDVKKLDVSERMLFAFGWCKYFGTPDYSPSTPYFSVEAIEYLISKGMKTILVDTFAPDCVPKDPANTYPVHKKLMAANVAIIESLANTHEIDFSKEYILAALPLKIAGTDGSPCRVALIEK